MFLDALSFIGLSFIQFNLGKPVELLVLSGLYLIAKGLIFRDFMSFVDMGIGIYILLATLFNIQSFIYYVILVWFAYKISILLIDT